MTALSFFWWQAHAGHICLGTIVVCALCDWGSVVEARLLCVVGGLGALKREVTVQVRFDCLRAASAPLGVSCKRTIR